MRRIASLVLPAVSLLLWSSWALAQSGTQQHRITPAPAEPCSSAAASRHPVSGCTPAPARTVYYTWCMTGGLSAPGARTSAYVSDVFLIDMAPYIGADVPQPAPGTTPFPWVNQFQQYVTQTYPHTGRVAVTCDNSNSEADAQARREPALRGAFPVVETGWKYAPSPPIAPPTVSAEAAIAHPATAAVAPSTPAVVAPPAAAAASPPAAAAGGATAGATAPGRAAAPPQAATAPSTPAPSATPQPRPKPSKPPEQPEKKPQYVACWAEVPSQHTAYFSATFEAQAMAAQRTEFRKMLMTTYGFVGQFNCTAKPSAAEAEQQLQQWRETARTKDTIVETGWKP